jgi:hypothetical protein
MLGFVSFNSLLGTLVDHRADSLTVKPLDLL